MIYPEIDEQERHAINVRMLDVRSDRKPLNDQERADLYKLVQQPGWMVLLRMMQDVCIQQEVDLINLPAGDNRAVIAEHAISKAMWLFFTRTQKKVQHEVTQMFPELTVRRDAEAEETYDTLDAVPR